VKQACKAKQAQQERERMQGMMYAGIVLDYLKEISAIGPERSCISGDDSCASRACESADKVPALSIRCGVLTLDIPTHMPQSSHDDVDDHPCFTSTRSYIVS
jgi:hypothetical protein